MRENEMKLEGERLDWILKLFHAEGSGKGVRDIQRSAGASDGGDVK
jgi:hypothetical protein